MAHKKAAGSTDNLKDSNPKYRGVKLFGGQVARAGNIIIRQKGDKYALGHNTYKGKDFTIHAGLDGVVAFRKKRIMRYDGRTYLKTVVDIIPTGEVSQPKVVKPQTKTPKVTAPKTPKTEVTAEKPVKKTTTKKPVARKAPAKTTAKAKSTSKSEK